MQGTGTLKRIFDFYRQGFSNMDIGKTLWMVIIVKLVVIFAIVKLLFMPDVLDQKATDNDKAEYISTRITLTHIFASGLSQRRDFGVFGGQWPQPAPQP